MLWRSTRKAQRVYDLLRSGDRTQMTASRFIDGICQNSPSKIDPLPYLPDLAPVIRKPQKVKHSEIWIHFTVRRGKELRYKSPRFTQREIHVP